MTPLIELKEAADMQLAQHYVAPARLCRDALQFSLHNGVELEVRLASASEYAFVWHYGDAELRIDTAPVAHPVATAPNHLHDADGRVLADPVTQPGRPPIENLQALFVALQNDPLLTVAGG